MDKKEERAEEDCETIAIKLGELAALIRQVRWKVDDLQCQFREGSAEYQALNRLRKIFYARWIKGFFKTLIS